MSLMDEAVEKIRKFDAVLCSTELTEAQSRELQHHLEALKNRVISRVRPPTRAETRKKIAESMDYEISKVIERAAEVASVFQEHRGGWGEFLKLARQVQSLAACVRDINDEHKH